MGRHKKEPTYDEIVAQKEKEELESPDRLPCLVCRRNRPIINFYDSNSRIYANNNRKIPICKDCVVRLYTELLEIYTDPIYVMFLICRYTDSYFDPQVCKIAEKQAIAGNSITPKIYFQKIGSMRQYKGKTFRDSIETDRKIVNNIPVEQYEKDIVLTDRDKENRKEVTFLCGFDPFEDENPIDKPYLYNTILSYLDETTIKDSFKLTSVISIVKTFCQIEGFDKAINVIMEDKDNLESNSAKLKSLIDIKKNLLTQILSYAKENGITQSKNNVKNKGDGTFSGLIAELRDKKMRPADVNLFDIKSCEAFKKITEISNSNIKNQLMLDENDFESMLAQQREMLTNLQSNYEELQEENRLLKRDNEMKSKMVDEINKEMEELQEFKKEFEAKKKEKEERTEKNIQNRTLELNEGGE